MRLIRLTLTIHLLSHAALWVSALLMLVAPWTGQAHVAHFYQVICGALIIHLGSYHWVMAQWQEDLGETCHRPASIYTALGTLGLGVVALMFPPIAIFSVLAAVALLVWQESWGAISAYIQPWYLRLRWLQMASLVATQGMVLLV